MERSLGFVLLLFFVSFHPSTWALDKSAPAIMKAVDESYRGDTRITIIQVVLIDKDKNRNYRKIRTVNKMYDQDEKSLTYILDPAKLKGTGFLSYDWNLQTRENEAWIYLPDLRKVTRLSASNRADYFLGSDFTYGDLERLEVDDFDYQFSENETPAAGEAIIDALPRADILDHVIDKTGYTRIRYWVDTERNFVMKAKYWLKDKGWMKYYTASKIEQVSGAWIAKNEQMILTQHDQMVHATLMMVDSIELNNSVDDSVFSTYGLEKGLQ
ncbi:MAG: outer membrane lipoprotein-sorting protein [Thiotrichaceae bacterium]|nr:outer membrane lipoprotein-sorting protein [Thiotrichaceae bacterium]PCI13170.1 MAG: hypothetical protein COB71_06820 [Thiotrichales bacterium]